MAIIPNFPQSLKDIHHNWHEPGTHPGAGPGRITQPGEPGAGLEFLTFHRNFNNQFHAWYDSQPFADPAAVAPWTAVPPQVRVPQVGWDSALAAQEARITTNNPPFGSADELGTYIEFGIHSWIHGAVALAFNEPEVADFHSPVSTLFYKIHGLVDYWWTQWQPPKSVIKDFIDNKQVIKEKEVAKEHKEIVKEAIKEFLEPKGPKDILEPKGPKELEPKGPKEFEPKGPKEKDKDIFEVPGRPPVLGNDPIIGRLTQRLNALETQMAAGRAFIAPEERPIVGDQAMEDEPDEHGEHGPDTDADNGPKKPRRR